MATSKEFIDEYGKLTFEEFPFCDADAVALCEIFYMPLEEIISDSFDDEPVDFTPMCEKMFAHDGYEHKPLGLFITNTPSKNLQKMGARKRYSQMKAIAMKSYYTKNPAVQFGAGTFLLPDGTAVIIYRGTNDDIAGWKEDVDFFTHREKGTYSYQLALEYIEAAAEKFSGDIIVCGHSKGGNVALWAAVNCKEETRKRIKYLYNYDGPGYYNYHIFNTGAYDELLPAYRHFVPSSSFIGMLLAHDYDYQAVKSSRLTGLLQHDLGTWQIEDGSLVTVADTDRISKINDMWIAALANRVATTDNCDTLDRFLTVITDSIEQKTLKEFSKNIKPAISAAAKAIREIDPETKANLRFAFGMTGKFIVQAVKDVKDKVAEEVTSLSFGALA